MARLSSLIQTLKCHHTSECVNVNMAAPVEPQFHLGGIAQNQDKGLSQDMLVILVTMVSYKLLWLFMARY